jgi:hypothetical protein
MHGSRVGKEFHAPALLDTMRPSATSALLRIASYTSTALPAPQAAQTAQGVVPRQLLTVADAAPASQQLT